MRVLMSAYACEPGRGSEPGVGWNWVLQAARFNEVWVLTRSNNRRSIERSGCSAELPGVTFVYFDLPGWARSWKRGSFGVRLYYVLWQFCIFWVAKRLHREVKFDLVHHVTFVNYWLPSALALMPLPFIWGPVGGGETAPKTFLGKAFRIKGKVDEFMRDIAHVIVNYEPLSRLTARRAACTFATTGETELKLRSLGCERLSVLSQVALPQYEIDQLVRLPLYNGHPFRLLSLGRFIYWKGFEFGVRAFARFHKSFPTSEYWLVGDGPERPWLEQLARNLGVADSVRFLGSMPRDQALEILKSCSVLVHPSLHDSGGYVCLEAMAAGQPIKYVWT